MRIKIGNHWFDSTNQPLAVELSDIEREQISNMGPAGTVKKANIYSSGPDSAFPDKQNWLDWLNDEYEI